MDFITEEIKTTLNLSDEQIAGLKPVHESFIAEQKKAWDTKANTDAEGILSGAAAKIEEVTSIKRNQGEKLADFYVRAGNEFLTNQKTEVENLKTEYAQKLKDFNGGDATKAELEKAKKDLDDALIKLADYDDLKAKADKYEPLETEYKTLKDKVFFQNEKPTFPDTVNPYEAEAKWNKFVNDFNEKWEKTFDESEKSVAVSKENPHLKKDLKELINADENLKTLLTGRNQQGTGAKPGHKVGDLEITLPENPSSEDKSKAINEYLDKLGISKMSKERTKKFAEILSKVEEALKK